MKLTKYEHACIVVEEQGQSLVIDPGNYTRELGNLQNVTAVVFTHVHGDHYGAQNLAAILKANPNAKIFGTHEVAAAGQSVTAVDAGQSVEVGPFKLEFFGGHHAFVFKDTPQNENVGVMINDRLYYPGDSFDTPNGKPIEILALPVSGPWMKIGEALEFIEAIKPSKLCVPTHDLMLSDIGAKIYEERMASVSAESGATFKPWKPGESIEA
ncbi:MAG TPA: MBL fold metallo-hydrolase [Candidatus Saccharimonadales bacterium]